MSTDNSTEEVSWYRQEWPKWAVPAGAAILGSVLTILAQQLFLPRTAAIEQKASLRKEIIKEQYSHILKIKRFAKIGSRAHTKVFVRRYVDPDGNIIGTSEEGPEYFLPAVADNDSLRREWRALAKEIKSRKNLIEPEVYEEFKGVIDFTKEKPLPDTNTVSGIEDSPYSDPEKVATFTALHEYLLTKVNKMTGFKK